MSLRIETKLVADGRRLASRAIVLQSLQSMPCYAFRRVILPVTDSHFTHRTHETWGGLGVASDLDEHAFDYEALGHCMVAIEHFLGGTIHDNGLLIQPDEVSMTGQVEPYNPKLKGTERLKNLPDWQPQKGDLFCLLLGQDNYLYMECIGKMGTSLMADFGVRYAFNQKFNLDFLTTFDETQLTDRSPLD